MPVISKGDIKSHLIEYFKIVKSYSSKYKIVFLSERIRLLYSLLKVEYPEIEFEDNNYSRKKMYINDLNYELPKRIGFNDLICTFAYVYNFHTFCTQNTPIPWSKEDLKIAHNNEYFIPKKYTRNFRVKLKGFGRVTSGRALDVLAKEINLFYEYKISNALELMPDFLQNYFNFWANNQEPLEYFLEEFYARLSMDDIKANEERIKLNNEEKTKLLLVKLFKIELKDEEKTEALKEMVSKIKLENEERIILKGTLFEEIIQKFGEEKLSRDFIKWITSDATDFYTMCHTSIKRNEQTKSASESPSSNNNDLILKQDTIPTNNATNQVENSSLTRIRKLVQKSNPTTNGKKDNS